MNCHSILRFRNRAQAFRVTAIWSRYGLALLCAGAALLLQMAVAPYTGQRYPFPAFYAGVALATWLGGSGPGVLALILGYLGEDWYIVLPQHLEILHPTRAVWIEASAYCFVGLSIIAVVCWIRHAERRARRAAGQARTEREQLEAVLQQMPVGVIIAEAPSGKLILHNEQAERIIGHRLSACYNVHECHNEFKAFHLDGRPYELADWPLARSLEKGEIVTEEEIEFVREDGRRVMASVSSAPIRDHHGKIVSVVKSFRDITERRHAQEARNRLAAIVENSPDAFVSLTLDGIICTWNCGAEQIFGYPAGEVIGQSVSILLPPERSAENQNFLERFRRGETTYHHEMVRMRKDGRRIFVNLTVSPIRDASERATGISLTARDITERKQREEALRRSEERLQLACKASNLGIWVWEPPTGHVEWSPEHYAIFGLSVGEREPSLEFFKALVHPEDWEKVWDTMQRALNERTFYRCEFRIIRPDGQLRWLMALGRAQYDPAGKPLSVSGVVMDITERRQAEESLRFAQQRLAGHAEDLAKQVAERTGTLQETIESLERVCYHMAHNLRAPLRSMQGFSSAVLEAHSAGLDETGKDFIRRVALSATRMDALIQDLLDYGKLSHVSLPTDWVKLDTVMKRVLGQFVDEIQSKGATIEIPRPLPLVWANSTLLEQILNNLLSNALKYVAPGVLPRVQIWADEDAMNCTIFVKDNGIGIEQDQHEKIFHVFERLYCPHQSPGTGIGLAIVQKGVQRMGGRVWVESTPGEGSCFCITLPKPACQPDGGDSHRETVNDVRTTTWN